MVRQLTRTEPRSSIDRSSPAPLYQQLEEIIRTEIERGDYRVGEMLPSEHAFCEGFGISRSVVRQTLHDLSNAGIIGTEPGRGRFVAEEKLSEHFVQRTTGFYDDLTKMGLAIETRVVLQEVSPVPPEARDFLAVDNAVRIDRVRSVSGRVLLYVKSYLPIELCPGLESHNLENRSLYAHLLDTYGLAVRSGHRTVEAASTPATTAQYLDVDEGAPVLLLRGWASTEDGAPLEWFEAWHRADLTRFEVEITPGDVAVPLEQTVDAGRKHGPTASPAPTDLWRTPFGTSIRETKVVAEVRAPRYGGGGAIAEALAAGGVTIVEFSLAGENALEAIEQARASSDSVVGGGGARTVRDCQRAFDAGAQFLIARARVREIAEVGSGVPVVLAGRTPSEIVDAYALTGSPVIVFPVEPGGPTFLRMLSARMPDIPLIPSGGVETANAVDYLKAGAVAVSIRSSLCPASAVAEGDVSELERRARDLVATIECSAQ